VDTLQMLQKRDYGPALLSGLGMIILAVAAAFTGLLMGRAL